MENKKVDLSPVNLGSLGRGALLEMFDLSIDKVISNIADSTTKPTAKREIVLKITVKPDTDRRVLEVTCGAKCTLAGVTDHVSRLFVGKDAEGRPYAFTEDPRQEMLFEPPVEDNNLLPMARPS